MDSNKMPKVDFARDKENISQSMRDYMKLVEKQNLDRVRKLQRIRRNNILTGCLLGSGVFGIYLYSMFAVQQERFLDDFEEPAKTSDFKHLVMAAQNVPRALRLPPLPTIKDIIRLYRLRALRQLSQNFLMDERVINKIVRAAGKVKYGQVCEVGPGPGGITRSILNQEPKRVVVIEKDPRFLPALELLADATDGIMETIIGDVMSYNLEKSFPEEYRKPWKGPPPNVHLMGNLPFSVSTILIIRWMEAISQRTSAWSYGRTKMTLTFQKEVAERMVAPVMSPQRCRLSIMCQNWCKVDHKFTISGSAFVPKPDVDVGVVHFVPLLEPVIPLPFKLVEKVVRNIFSFRQKYSIRGAETLFPVPKRDELGPEMFRLADIDPTTRPFQITVEEFGRLCRAYQQICDVDPRLYNYNHRAAKTQTHDFIDDEDVL